MKIRPLPDTDLARITVLREDAQRRELEKMKLGRPPYSYAPSRSAYLDIFAIQAGPLAPDLSPTPWKKIKSLVLSRSRTVEEQKANLGAAKALYDFATQNNVWGFNYTFNRLTLGSFDSVRFWEPAVLAFGKRRFVFFVDPRSTKRLTTAARNFIFSIMHEHIRANDPDLTSAGLLILSLSPKNGDSARTVYSHYANPEFLLDFSTLDSMIQKTYQIWIDVLNERREEEHRRGTGTSGPLI